MTTQHEKPLDIEDATNKIRGDLKAIFANVAKNAKGTSVAPVKAEDSSKQPGEQQASSANLPKK